MPVGEAGDQARSGLDVGQVASFHESLMQGADCRGVTTEDQRHHVFPIAALGSRQVVQLSLCVLIEQTCCPAA